MAIIQFLHNVSYFKDTIYHFLKLLKSCCEVHFQLCVTSVLSIFVLHFYNLIDAFQFNKITLKEKKKILKYGNYSTNRNTSATSVFSLFLLHFKNIHNYDYYLKKSYKNGNCTDFSINVITFEVYILTGLPATGDYFLITLTTSFSEKFYLIS